MLLLLLPNLIHDTDSRPKLNNEIHNVTRRVRSASIQTKTFTTKLLFLEIVTTLSTLVLIFAT